MLRRFTAILLALCLFVGMAFPALAESDGFEVVSDLGDEAPEEALYLNEALANDADTDVPPEDDSSDTPAEQPEAEGDKTVVVTYLGGEVSKVYDKTRNVSYGSSQLLDKKLTRADFSVSEPGVRIETITLGTFASPEVGSYTLTASFKLPDGYSAAPVSIPAKITPRPITVTPVAGQSKLYGESDPALIRGKVSGLLELTQAERDAGKQLFTGKVSREPGENVGAYAITLGTLDFDNPNYEVTLKSEVFTIRPKPIDALDVTVESGQEQQRYTGKAIKPEITLRYGARTLRSGVDFKVKYANNVKPGMATATLTGIGNYTGTRKVTFFIVDPRIEVTDRSISVSKIPNQVYTGRSIKPTVTVKRKGKKLTLNTDYTLSYEDNKAVGRATLTIKGKGDYKGSRSFPFEIVPKGTALSKLTPGKGEVALKWKKVSGVTGYQIAYSQKSSFSSQKKVTVEGAKSTKLTLSGLKSKKTYYIRVRAYQIADGMYWYSAWSKKEKVKVK